MKLSIIKVNSAAVEGGAWVGDIPGMGNLELKVRGIGNADYRRRRGELLRALPRRRGAALTVAEEDQITATLHLETILVDWRGLEGDDGKPLPYSREMAGKLLTEPDFAAFSGAVAWAAAVVAEERADDLEEDVGNSLAPSVGSSIGARRKTG